MPPGSHAHQSRDGDSAGEVQTSGCLDFADVGEFALALDALLLGE